VIRPVPRVEALGWKAHAALTRSGRPARVLARLRESIYLEAGAEILWLGGAGGTLHPRAVLVADPRIADGGSVRLDVTGLTPWRATPPRLTAGSADAIESGCRRLLASIEDVGVPSGLAELLVSPASGPNGRDGDALGRELGGRAAPHVRALIRACAANAAGDATRAATGLLGLGPGLTPSGDDYVGGAFFARALMSRAGVGDGTAWRLAADEVLVRARTLTHPIGVALLADLVEGDGPAPLHALARALAESAAFDVVVDAARRLVAIGHSSGWAMLAGFLGGAAAGPLPLATRRARW
jgi:uncharacterized protein DUF2877